MRRLLLTSCALSALSGVSAAQGSDLCSAAQAISGLGVFPFNNALASTDASGACAVTRDVWFRWTAPSTGNFTVSTCGLASFDTFLAAFGGVTCPPTNNLACNDDSCGLQSSLSFAAVAGNPYLIEVGSWNNTAGGAGSIGITAGGGGGGGGCANPSLGPDVIVGDISGVVNFGAVGPTSAYSLGTDSCNVGDQRLNWFASNPNHPVIGQNIYRLNDGRLEHIGQSWLKHGFAALQLNLCCSCVSSGTGTQLGVGCSDPYGASLNGSQPGLGPRSEVNATTGAFLYPFGAQGQSGDPIYKRAQVLTSDVLAANFPNATYFGEAQYIAPDDAAAGNGANNASWRPLTRSGTNFLLASATRRMQPALYAWREADPTVDVQIVDIPSEGRLWVASNCYDNGNGSYRYEYCVFNLNSHRSVREFTVPIGVGAQITGAGMSFPRSHSGEPYSNAAWSPQVLADRVTWSTDTFANDANANAIRWGTTYSFWYVSTNAPEVKTATLGLFRSGPQADPTVSVCGPVGGTGNPIVTNYCTAAPNSTGQTGAITAQNIDLNARTMQLAGASLPTNQSAFSIASRTQGFAANPGGSAGNICVAGDVGRVVGGAILNTGASGSIIEGVDLDSIAQPNGAASVLPGETWHFQLWHRDTIPGSNLPTSNFTDGVRVVFP